jgi:cytochrome oxidase Cu insertion factor (SCO1/SenC/PrrC family)
VRALSVAGEYPLVVALARARWAVWGLAVLIGVGAGIGLIEQRSPGRADSTPILSGPAMTWAAGARRAPPFRLVDQRGKAVSLVAYRGRPLVVTFLDPLCRNYCPIEASRLSAAVRSLPPAARPAVVAVSVNVYGNARRFLLQDMEKWNLGSGWRWGVGSAARLRSVWKRYGIGVRVTTKRITGVAVHNVVHTEAAYVVDGNGFERALLLWPFTAADVKSTLEKLH